VTTPASPPPAQFKVPCCRTRRSLLPGGVLVCVLCDSGLHVPRLPEATEVPTGETRWPPSL
jgi:hypothetical protein